MKNDERELFNKLMYHNNIHNYELNTGELKTLLHALYRLNQLDMAHENIFEYQIGDKVVLTAPFYGLAEEFKKGTIGEIVNIPNDYTNQYTVRLGKYAYHRNPYQIAPYNSPTNAAKYITVSEAVSTVCSAICTNCKYADGQDCTCPGMQRGCQFMRYKIISSLKEENDG